MFFLYYYEQTVLNFQSNHELLKSKFLLYTRTHTCSTHTRLQLCSLHNCKKPLKHTRIHKHTHTQAYLFFIPLLNKWISGCRLVVEIPQSHAAQLALVYILMGFKVCTIIIGFFSYSFSYFLIMMLWGTWHMSGGLDIYWLEQLHIFIYSVYYYY